jgi:hypothetical protein
MAWDLEWEMASMMASAMAWAIALAWVLPLAWVLALALALAWVPVLAWVLALALALAWVPVLAWAGLLRRPSCCSRSKQHTFLLAQQGKSGKNFQSGWRSGREGSP